MKIRITSDFSGYPDEVNERVFTTGQELDDLDDAYAEMLIGKGLAEPIAASAARPAPAAPAAAPAAPAIPAQTPAPPPAGQKKDTTA